MSETAEQGRPASEQASDASGPSGPAGPAGGQPLAPLRVGWVAGDGTLTNFAPTLNPLAVGLMDELVKVTLLSPAKAGAAELAGPLTDVVRYTVSAWPMRQAGLKAAGTAVVANKLELLHALDFTAARLTRDLAGRCNLPYVVSSFSMSDTRRAKRLDGRLGAVLAAGEKIELGLIRHHVAPAAKVHRLRPGLYTAKRARCFRDPTHSVAIVAACRLARWPVLTAVCEAFAKLKADGYDCIFVIIASGRLAGRLRRHVRQAGLEHDLTLADHHSSEQLGKVIMAGDLFVSPDAGPQIDFGSMMAMASGVPVLAGHVGRDMDDFIIDGETAEVFDPAASGALAGKLAGMLDDHAAARSLADKALDHIRRNYSPTAMVSAVSNIYRSVIGQFTSRQQK